MRRDDSASSDSEDEGDDDDELNDGSSDSGSSEYGSVASFASAHTSTFAQDSETSRYLQAVELINRHDFAVATSTGDDASRGGTAVTGRKVGDGGEAFGSDDSMGSDGGDDDDEEEDDDERENEEASSLSDDDDEDAAWTPRARLPAPQPVNQSFSLFFHPEARHRQGSDQDLPPRHHQPAADHHPEDGGGFGVHSPAVRRPGRAGDQSNDRARRVLRIRVWRLVLAKGEALLADAG